MGLQDTPTGERVHIGFFGVRNAGKSSLVNAVTGQDLSVVSDVKGTTTDPVQKSMELLPIGPVVILDTPGLDDEGELGQLRVQKAKQALAKTDIAVLVVDATADLGEEEQKLLALIKSRPHLIARTKADLLPSVPAETEDTIYVSAKTGLGVHALKEKLGALAKSGKPEKRVIADLLKEGDTVVLVIPVDESAPKGRLILPQQLVLRDLLDAHCTAVCCQPQELKATLANLQKAPKLVVTDSQAFGAVAKDVTEDVLLTSFSILLARYKGVAPLLVRGAAKLGKLTDADTVLISEGCTHHRQCNDIGTVKLPNWIRSFSGASPSFRFTSGGEFPEDFSGISLVLHCGGCMLNAEEMHSRMQRAKAAGVPVVNYGVAIAHLHGILRRSLAPFPELLKLLDE